MMVSDLALREDPIYSPIAKSWSNDLPALTTAFAAAWCKISIQGSCQLIFTFLI